jgi:hypothetical protein
VGNDDGEAGHVRAMRIRNLIDRWTHRSGETAPRESGQESPRDFIERRMQELGSADVADDQGGKLPASGSPQGVPEAAEEDDD